jgi:hypothetical protein
MDRTLQPQVTAIDRRGTLRFRVNVPLTVTIGDLELPAYTENLSNRGVYFYLDSAHSTIIDPDFSFVVELPPEITLSTCCWIRCRGKVLRKEKASGDSLGVAAEILDYSILREPVPSA